MKIKSSAVVTTIGLAGIIINVVFFDVGPMWLTIVGLIASVYAFGSGAYVMGVQKGLAAAIALVESMIEQQTKAPTTTSPPETDEEVNALLGSMFNHYKP